jgi:hypothetical protein
MSRQSLCLQVLRLYPPIPSADGLPPCLSLLLSDDNPPSPPDGGLSTPAIRVTDVDPNRYPTEARTRRSFLLHKRDSSCHPSGYGTPCSEQYGGTSPTTSGIGK